jgi:hypothetical protein
MKGSAKNYYREVALPSHVELALRKDFGFSEKDAAAQVKRHMPYIRAAHGASHTPFLIAASVAKLRRPR